MKFITAQNKQNTKPKDSTNHKTFNGPKGNPTVLRIKMLFLSHGTGKHDHEQRSEWYVCSSKGIHVARQREN